ncbi:iron-containing alcohol dehydrogenase [Kiloniella sp.]|uniref:iron-containing alcohol dehydrogenase n=1 Tax=Kiloniella sp. TaxID=1938587 RepID=UPI003B01CE5F
MDPFTFNTSASIQFGAGLLSKLGNIVKDNVGNRILLVTDQGMLATGIIDRSLEALSSIGIEVTLYSNVRADPPEKIGSSPLC